MSDSSALATVLSLEGKVALVTGGGGGIGSAVCHLFLRAGARVASVDLPGRGCVDGALELPYDVASREGVARLFEAFRDRFDRLDVLVHCAGVTRDAVVWKMTDEAWGEVIRINLDSAFLVLREAIPSLRSRRGGAVVLVSSINGERGKFGQANYAASKAGLIGLARSAARELGASGTRVNVIAPGFIETPMTAGLDERFRKAAVDESALGAVGKPEDVAMAALFLASSMSAHVTGQVLRVDGGQLMA